MMKPRTEEERAERLYVPVPVPTNESSRRARCNVWVPIGTSAPWWLVVGWPEHGDHVEALPFGSSAEAWSHLGQRTGFLVDARVMFEVGRSRFDVVFGVSVQHSSRFDPALGGSELNRRTTNTGENDE
jgi:hypothetical protein